MPLKSTSFISLFMSTVNRKNETMELDHETAVRAAAMGEAHQHAGGPHLDAWDDDSDSFGSAASRHDGDDENDAAVMPPADDDGALAISRPDAAYDDDDDDEEAECRVCRGPAEEG